MLESCCFAREIMREMWGGNGNGNGRTILSDSTNSEIMEREDQFLFGAGSHGIARMEGN